MATDPEAPVTASAEAFIRAPQALVWQVQTDLRSWPMWNPQVAAIDVRGPLAPGTEFRWKAAGLPIVSTPRLVEPERRIRWTGRAPLGLRAVHTWSFEPEDGGTRVRTDESFEGRLARVFSAPLRRILEQTLEKGVTALKAEAEPRVRSDAG